MKSLSKSGWTRSLAVVAATAGVAGGAALYAQQAGAQSPAHTLHVVNKQLQDKIIRGVDVATDRDSDHGSPSGYDVTACRVNPQSHRAACDVAMARPGGLLYVHATINVQTGRGGGTVTGGTRNFHNARGTVTVNGSAVTIVYHV